MSATVLASAVLLLALGASAVEADDRTDSLGGDTTTDGRRRIARATSAAGRRIESLDRVYEVEAARPRRR